MSNNVILQFFDKSDILHITNKEYKKSVCVLFDWLVKNDKVTNDITTKALSPQSNRKIRAKIVSRKHAIAAGLEEITYFVNSFTHLQCNLLKEDGDTVEAGETILQLEGSVKEILIFERTILNILQRLCGIATETAKNVSFVRSLRLVKEPFIAATRKTVWGPLDKKAVAVGGGLTHRLDLSDGILVKDNHLLILKEQFQISSEEEVVVKALDLIIEKVQNTLIEIEVEDTDSIPVLLQTFQKRQTGNLLGILLDNFTPDSAKNVIDKLQKNNLENVIFEASGGITSENLPLWAASGVDLISLGALTHSAKAADISLEL